MQRFFRVSVTCRNVDNEEKTERFRFEFVTHLNPVEATVQAIKLLETMIDTNWRYVSFPTVTEIFPHYIEV